MFKAMNADEEQDAPVTIRTSRDTVVIPWGTRQELLKRLRRRQQLDPAAAAAVDAVEQVGASNPVTLSAEAEQLLTQEVDLWLLETGIPGLPEGIWDLRCALIDEQNLDA
jgi:hypothetical protein